MVGKHYRVTREIIDHFDAIKGIGSTTFTVEALKEAAVTREVFYVVHSYEFASEIKKRFSLSDIDGLEVGTLAEFALGDFRGSDKIVVFDHYALYKLLIGLLGEIKGLNKELNDAWETIDKIRVLVRAAGNRRSL